MSDGQEVDDTRTTVKTYVPAYQKSEWAAHADRLGMSQSEFVRAMVQAGRRGFEFDDLEPDVPDATPRGDGLETGVLEVLSRNDHLSWNQLVERLAGNFEDRLEETLQCLQDENRVQHSGRHDGYTVVE